jgi:hypothetical protein
MVNKASLKSSKRISSLSNGSELQSIAEETEKTNDNANLNNSSNKQTFTETETIKDSDSVKEALIPPTFPSVETP